MTIHKVAKTYRKAMYQLSLASGDEMFPVLLVGIGAIIYKLLAI